MKPTAQLLAETVAAPRKTRGSLLAELFKARLTSLVLLTTLVGFYLGQRGGMNWLLLVNTLLGTGLLVALPCILLMLRRRASALLPMPC